MPHPLKQRPREPREIAQPRPDINRGLRCPPPPRGLARDGPDPASAARSRNHNGPAGPIFPEPTTATPLASAPRARRYRCQAPLTGLSSVTRRQPALPSVTRCYPASPAVTRCDPALPSAALPPFPPLPRPAPGPAPLAAAAWRARLDPDWPPPRRLPLAFKMAAARP